MMPKLSLCYSFEGGSVRLNMLVFFGIKEYQIKEDY
jgi:hypothetical protein